MATGAHVCALLTLLLCPWMRKPVVNEMPYYDVRQPRQLNPSDQFPPTFPGDKGDYITKFVQSGRKRLESFGMTSGESDLEEGTLGDASSFINDTSTHSQRRRLDSSTMSTDQDTDDTGSVGTSYQRKRLDSIMSTGESDGIFANESSSFNLHLDDTSLAKSATKDRTRRDKSIFIEDSDLSDDAFEPRRRSNVLDKVRDSSKVDIHLVSDDSDIAIPNEDLEPMDVLNEAMIIDEDEDMLNKSIHDSLHFHDDLEEEMDTDLNLALDDTTFNQSKNVTISPQKSRRSNTDIADHDMTIGRQMQVLLLIS